jgi:ketosteroid isomerase-like protein
MNLHIPGLVPLALTVALLPGSAGAQSTGDQASVVAAVEALHNAITTGDSSLVMRMLAEDVVIFEAGGVESRAQYVSNHLPADIEFEKAVKSQRSPIRAVVLGETAWASSTNELVGSFQGRAVDLVATELMVLTKVPDGWRIRAISWSSRSRVKPAPAQTPSTAPAPAK